MILSTEDDLIHLRDSIDNQLDNKSTNSLQLNALNDSGYTNEMLHEIYHIINYYFVQKKVHPTSEHTKDLYDLVVSVINSTPDECTQNLTTCQQKIYDIFNVYSGQYLQNRLIDGYIQMKEQYGSPRPNIDKRMIVKSNIVQDETVLETVGATPTKLYKIPECEDDKYTSKCGKEMMRKYVIENGVCTIKNIVEDKKIFDYLEKIGKLSNANKAECVKGWRDSLLNTGELIPIKEKDRIVKFCSPLYENVITVDEKEASDNSLPKKKRGRPKKEDKPQISKETKKETKQSLSDDDQILLEEAKKDVRFELINRHLEIQDICIRYYKEDKKILSASNIRKELKLNDTIKSFKYTKNLKDRLTTDINSKVDAILKRFITHGLLNNVTEYTYTTITDKPVITTNEELDSKNSKRAM